MTSACPNCHFSKGLWSPLDENKGTYLCKIDPSHRFTRDKDGNFHTVK